MTCACPPPPLPNPSPTPPPLPTSSPPHLLSSQVVLMSATLESREYAQYFAVRLPKQLSPTPAPVLSVEGRVWPVMDFYLDDLRDFGEVCVCLPSIPTSIPSFIHLSPLPPLPHQVEGLMPENPRVNLTQLQMAKNLIQYFDDLETDDPK